jgi:hypothetical protein
MRGLCCVPRPQNKLLKTSFQEFVRFQNATAILRLHGGLISTQAITKPHLRGAMLLVRMRGLEPPRDCSHYDLNVACLPIPAHPQNTAREILR